MQLLKALVPAAIKQLLRERHRRHVLSRAVREWRKLPPEALLPHALITDLIYGWGNEAWSVEPAYIQEFVTAAWRAPGSILECGSGLSTLMLGIVAQQRGLRVWSLEHHPQWHARMRAVLDRFGIHAVELCLVELRDYDPEYAWYTLPANDFPRDFAVVICDGPPSQTRGGRYGMLPVMRTRLLPGCAILLDDLDREAEQETLRRWSHELGAAPAVEGGRKPFGRLIVPGARN